MSEKKSVGMIGGMGPMATADLFRKITALTKAGKDSEHIRVYIDSNPEIPDRTAAILQGGPDPVPAMVDALVNLEACGADCIVMPCNTAHYFLPRLREETGLPFISMIDETARACREERPGAAAGILATSGTLSAGLYQKALSSAGVPYLEPSAEEQKALMSVIYDGVKAGADPSAYRDAFQGVLNAMTARGADYFLLACTELPLAFQALGRPADALDPTELLARAVIRFCGYEVREA